MNTKFWRYAGALSVLAATSSVAGCTTDDNEGDAKGGASSAGATSTGGAGGAGGASTAKGGGANGGNGGASTSGSVCANPIVIAAAKTGIADFDGWDGATSIGTWSFALGGDSSTGVYAGPFGYGDRTGNLAETFDMPAGYNSTKYSLRVADTNAVNFGGGLGIWLSSCISATTFSGVSFWVKGNSPTGKATFKISMEETTSTTPSTSGTFGTCKGDDKTCVHPTFEFAVTDTWTQIKAPWSGFKAGTAAGTAVTPDGRHITQFGIDIGLVWAPDAGGVYVPTAAPYELDVDSVAFY